jgi:hypothetical protein
MWTMNRMLIFLLQLPAVSAPCHAQIVQQVYEVQVLVLDYKTGRPVPEWEVAMMLPNIKGKYPPYSSTIWGKTGKSGTVFFPFQSPIPQQVSIMTDWDGYSCTSQDVFDTSKVLQQGVIGDFELCKNIKSGTVTAQPGEIVIYLRRPNRWQRIERFFRNTFSGC